MDFNGFHFDLRANFGSHLVVKVQIVEIYNEHFRDLLSPASEAPRLMFSPASGGASLQGVTHRRISREKDMLKSLQARARVPSLGGGQ